MRMREEVAITEFEGLDGNIYSLEIYGNFEPGSPPVFYYRDGSGHPGDPAEFDINYIRVYKLDGKTKSGSLMRTEKDFGWRSVYELGNKVKNFESKTEVRKLYIKDFGEAYDKHISDVFDFFGITDLDALEDECIEYIENYYR